MRRNFRLKEFRGFPEKPTSRENYMLECLADNLQVIRDHIRRPIIITSCYRTRQEYLRLLNLGYYPSETSDHYFGQRIPIYGAVKQITHGTEFDTSVGAVDFVCDDIDNAFTSIVMLSKQNLIRIGQVIIESSDRSRWIHISNDPELVYSVEFCKQLPKRKKYLFSLDGGRTYREWTQ